jgi:alkylation response protein AidB-like acyl-CoA dehydrogenase
VGEENKGWTYAKFLLGHERTNIAGIGIAKRELARLKRIAAAEGRLDQPLFAARWPRSKSTSWRWRSPTCACWQVRAEREHKAPGPEASILKIKGTEIQQAISELMMQAVGACALPFKQAGVGPDYAANLGTGYCNLRKLSIFGGSNEIQKNIISQMIMGHGLISLAVRPPFAGGRT